MMKQVKGSRTFLILFALPFILAFAGVAQGKISRDVAPNVEVEPAQTVSREASPSCAAPDAEHAQQCRAMEARILAATLRLQILVKAPKESGGYEIVDRSNGHATVMGGRYLVTHNHFSLSLDNLYDGTLRTLSAYGPDGSVIVQDAPFHTFKVLIAEPQTLVFDFGMYAGHGALAYAGFASAPFADWQALDLQVGDEVAQVNWDGTSTFVDWVRVSRTRLEDGTRALELDNYVEQGASGGGVFYQGMHIGNNWFHGVTEHAVSGEALGQFTVAALNQANLMTLAQGGERSNLAGAGLEPAVAGEEAVAQ